MELKGKPKEVMPIECGNNSWEKWKYGRFSGNFNTLLVGEFVDDGSEDVGREANYQPTDRETEERKS